MYVLNADNILYIVPRSIAYMHWMWVIRFKHCLAHLHTCIECRWYDLYFVSLFCMHLLSVNDIIWHIDFLNCMLTCMECGWYDMIYIYWFAQLRYMYVLSVDNAYQILTRSIASMHPCMYWMWMILIVGTIPILARGSLNCVYAYMHWVRITWYIDLLKCLYHTCIECGLYYLVSHTWCIGHK